MALATLPTTIARPVTDKRIATEVIRNHAFLDQWWTTVHGMSYTVPANPSNPRIRARVGDVDLESTGPVPFDAGGYRPATFNDASGMPYFTAPLPASNVYSFIFAGVTLANAAEMAGMNLGGTALGFRPVQNGSPAIVSGSSVMYRPTAITTAVGDPATFAVVLDYVNAECSIAMNGGDFISGQVIMPAMPTEPGQLLFGAQTPGLRHNGTGHECAYRAGSDLRDNLALWQDFCDYTASIWGA